MTENLAEETLQVILRLWRNLDREECPGCKTPNGHLHALNCASFAMELRDVLLVYEQATETLEWLDKYQREYFRRHLIKTGDENDHD